MTRRKRASGGQALVMVTLALFSMVGMMGLAIDIGWSNFSQKQAQAAADTAALAAAQEAVQRLGVGSNVSGFSCASTGTGASQVECTESPGATTLKWCGSTVASTSNLNNGCLYAKRNGFQYGSGSRQSVSIQSGDVTDVNAPPGVKRISYWVRVRTIQTIPQLFSAISGNKQGTVAANATAAIAGIIKPGSFYGMNRAGDCSEGGDCGLDFQTGHGKGGGSGGSQACGPNGINSDFCAPGGIVLASSCGASGGTGCDQNAAGIEHTTAVASSLTIMGPAGIVSGTVKDLNGNPVTAVNSTNQSLFQDPTAPNSQPPLATSGANIGTCAIPSGNSSTATIPGTLDLGPYLYYSYHTTSGGKPVPDGKPITVSGTATLSQGAGSAGASANCPAVSAGGLSTVQTGGAANQSNANFPTYIFVGGLVNNGKMYLGPGQVVMAGTNSSSGNVFDNEGTVDGTKSAAEATGSMFIFTDAAYPGMNLTSSTAANFQPLVSGATGTALYQGTVAVNGSTEMYGLVNSSVAGSNVPANMNLYTGVVWWQDRRNSNVGYNEASGSSCGTATCTGDNGSVISCAIGCPYGSQATPNVMATINHVTTNSPGGVQFGNGNTKVALNGVYYQPRGAWTDLGNGNTGFNCPATSTGQCPLQLITGALFMGNGTTRMELAGPTNSLLSYKAVLIQ